MGYSGWVEVAPHETTEIPDARVSVYHDGDKETTVFYQAGGTVKLGATNGQWQIKVLGGGK